MQKIFSHKKAKIIFKVFWCVFMNLRFYFSWLRSKFFWHIFLIILVPFATSYIIPEGNLYLENIYMVTYDLTYTRREYIYVRAVLIQDALYSKNKSQALLLWFWLKRGHCLQFTNRNACNSSLVCFSALLLFQDIELVNWKWTEYL